MTRRSGRLRGSTGRAVAAVQFLPARGADHRRCAVRAVEMNLGSRYRRAVHRRRVDAPNAPTNRGAAFPGTSRRGPTRHITAVPARASGWPARVPAEDRRPSARYGSVRLPITPASNCRPRACNCRSDVTMPEAACGSRRGRWSPGLVVGRSPSRRTGWSRPQGSPSPRLPRRPLPRSVACFAYTGTGNSDHGGSK